MKIMSIGDVHGRTDWQEWEDIPFLLKNLHLKTDYDFYVFVGDYTDSHTLTSQVILENLKQIIQFKKNYPEKVILLLGNHDLQYWYGGKPEFICSGYMFQNDKPFFEIFEQNRNLFQAAFQIDNYLWTHAGLHQGWYKQSFPNHLKTDHLSADLNAAFRMDEKSLFDVGPRRGGYKSVGGPFWADKVETYDKPLIGYHQIVGHTPVKAALKYFKGGDRWCNTSVTYIDCQEPYFCEV